MQANTFMVLMASVLCARLADVLLDTFWTMRAAEVQVLIADELEPEDDVEEPLDELESLELPLSSLEQHEESEDRL